MKITPEHQYKLEELMLAEAIKRGATSLNDWIVKAREAIVNGQIPAPKKSEAVLIFSYLLRGKALEFVCDTIYTYANDDHMKTLQERMFKRHA